jgi:hypothetical protein
LAQGANGAELRFQRNLKHTGDEILGFIVHGGLLSMGSRTGAILRSAVNNKCY